MKGEMLIVISSFLEKWGESLFSAIAVILSIVAMIKARKAEKLQYKLNELEFEIKQYALDKIKKEQEKENCSCIEARVVSMGKDNYRMKIWNSGNTIAYKVSARFDEDVGIKIYDQGKQPYDELEPGKNYELTVFAFVGHKSKFRIITEWTDENGEKMTKIQMGGDHPTNCVNLREGVR